MTDDRPWWGHRVLSCLIVVVGVSVVALKVDAAAVSRVVIAAMIPVAALWFPFLFRGMTTFSETLTSRDIGLVDSETVPLVLGWIFLLVWVGYVVMEYRGMGEYLRLPF